MLAVVSVLRTSLVAVPALSRVEPASTSGPGAGRTSTSARLRSDRDRWQDTRTVRQPRAHEDEAPAPAERADDQPDGGGGRARHTPHRGDRPAILPIHQHGDLERREPVEGAARAIRALGRQPLVANSLAHGRAILLFT